LTFPSTGRRGAAFAPPGDGRPTWFQARETPVAQDPTSNDTTEDESNAADEPDTGTGSVGAARPAPVEPG